MVITAICLTKAASFAVMSLAAAGLDPASLHDKGRKRKPDCYVLAGKSSACA